MQVVTRGSRSRLNVSPIRQMVVNALLICLLALTARLYAIGYRLPEPDELHWIERSYRVIERWREGHLSTITTHLGHPGIPPALVMAGAQLMAERWNDRLGLQAEDPRFVDRLVAARSGNAVLSSLIPPTAYLLLAPITGGSALVLGCVLAVDPRFVGLGRIAHIDSGLALFVLLTLALFFKAEERRSLPLKLCAGCTWALAFMTKPTAVLIVPAFLCYKAIAAFVDRRIHPSGAAPQFRRRVVDWGDVGAVLVAHVVFALTYTRLWPHESDYLIRLHVQSSVADFLYTNGMWLRTLLPVPLTGFALSAAAAASAVFAFRRRSERTLAFHMASGLLFVTLAAASVFMFPAVVENIVRFWSWVLGLSKVSHVAYGTPLPPPPGGYPGLLISRLPSVAVVLIATGFLSALLAPRVLRRELAPEAARMVLLSVIVSVLWIAFLSTSSKQTLRYVLPVVPFMYLSAIVLSGALIRAVAPRLERPLGAALIVLFAIAGYAVAPYFEFFFNSITGGASAAVRRGHLLPIGGAEELIERIEERAALEQRRFSVSVIGDYEALVLGMKHRAHANGAVPIVLLPVFSPETTDFVIAEGWKLGTVAEKITDRFAGAERVASKTIDGTVVAALYWLPLPDYREPHVIPPSFFHRRTGDMIGPRADEASGTLRLQRGKSEKGFALTGFGLRFSPGRYAVSIDAELLPESEPLDRENPGVFRISLGKECEGIVREADLMRSAEHAAPHLICTFESTRRPQLDTYWFGLRSARIRGVVVQAVP